MYELEHYEAKDREHWKRITEIVQIDLWLFVYPRTHDTMGEDYYRKYALLNALILDYGKTYGTKAQEHLKELMDDVRDQYLAREHEFEDIAKNSLLPVCMNLERTPKNETGRKNVDFGNKTRF